MKSEPNPYAQKHSHRFAFKGKTHHMSGNPVPMSTANQRFEKPTLDNSVKLTTDNGKDGTLVGYDVRYYDREEYARTGQMVEHDKSFTVEEREEMKAFLRKTMSKDGSSNVKSKYVQERRKLADGSIERSTIDANSLF